MNKLVFIIFVMLVCYNQTNTQGIELRNDKSYMVNKNIPFTLKAILIVGPQEDGTADAIESMKKVAAMLSAKGIKVQCFYGKDAVWDKIKIAAKNANIFIYSGHGITMGEGGRSGGLCLDKMVTSKEMIEGLQLHSNAIVIFKSVCRGAGSSAEDDADIGIDEATTRVSDYSKSFFDCGAACYFANNFENGCQLFLGALFAGSKLKDCFIESTKTITQTKTENGVEKVKQIASPDVNIEIAMKYKFDKNKQISIASYNSGQISTRTTYINGVKKVEQIPSFKEYEIAYVGNPGFTILNMIK